MSHWIALFLAILGNVGANIAFKRFTLDTEFSRSVPSVMSALTHPALWIGLFLGFGLLVCYVFAIRSIPLSMAYTAATSLSIVGVTCAGVLIYGDTIGLRSIVGIAAVLAGVALITTA
jgi:multidrug transporter EmrE-like cation transporter